ncbi:uncharacterized protein LOC116351139 isoform X1 [Contarinia nasturtii]|uniref:uncharacterized protein LOC116351139 isoform X1 n=1 Tax=Contarinia nasturtii TaxID=265458 RepID=UPI0012D3F57F|nr:uncharacterized protein LOC116351139 isoform X1 [Contarinia nasturtii]
MPCFESSGDEHVLKSPSLSKSIIAKDLEAKDFDKSLVGAEDKLYFGKNDKKQILPCFESSVDEHVLKSTSLSKSIIAKDLEAKDFDKSLVKAEDKLYIGKDDKNQIMPCFESSVNEHLLKSSSVSKSTIAKNLEAMDFDKSLVEAGDKLYIGKDEKNQIMPCFESSVNKHLLKSSSVSKSTIARDLEAKDFDDPSVEAEDKLSIEKYDTKQIMPCFEYSVDDDVNSWRSNHGQDPEKSEESLAKKKFSFEDSENATAGIENNFEDLKKRISRPTNIKLKSEDTTECIKYIFEKLGYPFENTFRLEDSSSGNQKLSKKTEPIDNKSISSHLCLDTKSNILKIKNLKSSFFGSEDTNMENHPILHSSLLNDQNESAFSQFTENTELELSDERSEFLMKLSNEKYSHSNGQIKQKLEVRSVKSSDTDEVQSPISINDNTTKVYKIRENFSVEKKSFEDTSNTQTSLQNGNNIVLENTNLKMDISENIEPGYDIRVNSHSISNFPNKLYEWNSSKFDRIISSTSSGNEISVRTVPTDISDDNVSYDEPNVMNSYKINSENKMIFDDKSIKKNESKENRLEFRTEEKTKTNASSWNESGSKRQNLMKKSETETTFSCVSPISKTQAKFDININNGKTTIMPKPNSIIKVSNKVQSTLSRDQKIGKTNSLQKDDINILTPDYIHGFGGSSSKFNISTCMDNEMNAMNTGQSKATEKSKSNPIFKSNFDSRKNKDKSSSTQKVSSKCIISSDEEMYSTSNTNKVNHDKRGQYTQIKKNATENLKKSKYKPNTSKLNKRIEKSIKAPLKTAKVQMKRVEQSKMTLDMDKIDTKDMKHEQIQPTQKTESKEEAKIQKKHTFDIIYANTDADEIFRCKSALQYSNLDYTIAVELTQDQSSSVPSSPNRLIKSKKSERNKQFTSEVFMRTVNSSSIEMIYNRRSSNGDNNRRYRELEAGFIDTTDSSLSDSVALPSSSTSENQNPESQFVSIQGVKSVRHHTRQYTQNQQKGLVGHFGSYKISDISPTASPSVSVNDSMIIVENHSSPNLDLSAISKLHQKLKNDHQIVSFTGVESPQKLEDDLNDASSTNDSRSLRSLITPKPTPRSFNPNNYDAIASETVDDVHTSEIDKDDNRACTAIDRSSGDFSETKKFWQSLESGSIDDPNISPIPKPRSQSHVQVRGVRYINDDFDTVNLLTSITPNEQNISQTSLSNKDIDRHNVPITDHLNNVSPKLSDHNDIILHSAEKYSASIYNVKERENILDDDDDEDVLNEKKTAAFYIGESSGDLITKSAIEKQPIIAYDIDGKELKDVVKLDQKTEIECSDYKYEVRFNLQPEEIGVASYGKLDNIQQIRMHKSLEEKCETEIPENVILESPNSNDQAECSKSCDTSLEQATINFQSKIELKETAEQFEYTAPTCTISKSQEIEKNIDEERIETFEPVKMAETILLQSDHSTRKILDSTEKVQFHDKAVKVCHAPIDTLSNVSQNIDEIKIASNERRKNEKSQFEFDSNMEHYDIIEPKTTLVVNIPVENLNQEQYIEVEAIESESTQKPKFQANFVHEFSDKITSEIIKPEDNIIDYTLDPDEDKIYPVAHMNMLLRQECSNKMETRVGEVSQKQSTDESSLTTSKSEVIHRTGSSKGASKTRWSLNEQDHSSPSSHSVDNSRPCSSDIENLYVSYPNSSGEYQTALDASSLIPGSTEYHTAVSSFDHSGKTISSEESMKSFDSEISSNLGSIEVSDASETLVPSTADIDLEFDENELRLSSLHTVSDIILDAENPLELDSDESAGQMRRSHEMIFAHVESSNTTDMPNRKVSEEEFNVQQFSTTLGDASNLSISFSTASNADTIIENIQEDMATSYDAVSLVGSYERRASLMNDIFSSQEKVPHAETDNDRITEIDNMTPRRSKGHKRNDSTCIDLAKLSQESTDSLLDEEMIIHDVREEDEQKESGSDSDYDRYETEYSRSFKTPESKNFQRKKKAMSPKSAQKPEQEQTERKKSIPNIETIVEVSEDDIQKLRNHGISQNMNIYNYSIIPNIKITDITDDPTKCFEKMEPITVPEKKKPINQDQN